MRLDLIVSSKLNISRNSASELIKNGKILVNGVTCLKPSQKFEDDIEISILDDIFVGRGALKLRGFLDKSSLNLTNLKALDIGSSTGGFVEILLSCGVSSVTAVDVGTAQLHQKLANDPRVKLFENTDIRDFDAQKFDIITCDVSFISILQILPKIYELSISDVILLFKPQFEVGKDTKRDKNGVVKDQRAVELARARFLEFSLKLGFEFVDCKECEISGKRGNIEYFYHFKKR